MTPISSKSGQGWENPNTIKKISGLDFFSLAFLQQRKPFITKTKFENQLDKKIVMIRIGRWGEYECSFAKVYLDNETVH